MVLSVVQLTYTQNLFHCDDIVKVVFFHKLFLFIKIIVKSNQLSYKHKVVKKTWELDDVRIGVLKG